MKLFNLKNSPIPLDHKEMEMLKVLTLEGKDGTKLHFTLEQHDAFEKIMQRFVETDDLREMIINLLKEFSDVRTSV